MRIPVNSGGKINNLQALRALAAGVVAFRHIGAQLNFFAVGGFGVDVFFVISGFVMTQICESGRTEWFMWRRIARIVPLYWGVTLCLFGLSIVAPKLVVETRPNAVYLIKSLLFIPFQKDTGQLQPFLFLGWTLNFEMYFYVLLAIALLLWPKRAVWITAVFITAVFLWSQTGRNAFAYFYGNSMVFEFIAGAVVFYLYNATGQERARRFRFVFWAVAILALAVLAWFDSHIPTMGNTRAIYLGIPAACLVAAVLGISRGGSDSPWPWIVLLGDASYVMYLIHPFVEIGMEKLIVRLVPSLAHNLVVMSCLLMGAVALASVLIYQFVDLPTQQFLRFKKKSRTPQASAAAVP